MDRRGFASKVSGVVAATYMTLVKPARGDALDLSKKSKAKREDEEHIIVKILGFHGEKVGELKKFPEYTSWTCKYEVTRIDGTVVTRESSQVLSNARNDPPMRYHLDLS